MKKITSDRFAYGAKIILYVISALLPLWLLPLPVAVELGREITFGSLVAIAALLWLLSLLTQGRISYVRSSVLSVGIILLAGFVASALFSEASFSTLLFAGPSAERFTSIAMGIVLMYLAAMILRSEQEITLAFLLLQGATLVSGIISLVQLVGHVAVYQAILPFVPGLQSFDFTSVGTVNGLSILYAAMLISDIGFLCSPEFVRAKAWIRYGAIASLFVLGVNLALINFWAAWIVLLGSGMFLAGILLRRAPQVSSVRLAFQEREANPDAQAMQKRRLGWRYSFVFVFLALTLFALLKRDYSFARHDLSLEISPNLAATLGVAKSVLSENPSSFVLGSGPGTFAIDWNRYKDAAVNQTPFWQVQFQQGFSWITTLAATAGAVGVMVFLAFLGVAFFVFLRALLMGDRQPAFLSGLLLGFVALAISIFVYPINLSLLLVFFLVVGLMVALTKKEAVEALSMETLPIIPDSMMAPLEESRVSGSAITRWLRGAWSGFWRGDAEDRHIHLETPWAVFLFSLAAIFLLFLGVSFLYLQVGRVQAAVAEQRGIAAINKGAYADAASEFAAALGHQEALPQSYQALLLTGIERVKNIIQRAVRGENVQEEFRSILVQTTQYGQRANKIFSHDPALWRAQGTLYELIIPFLDGAQTQAFASYQRAAELDPQNPAVYADWGRAGLAFADRVAFLLRQAEGENRSSLEKIYANTLENIRVTLKKAIALKSDFATAHFLMAQTALRFGNLPDAIASTEQASRAAPDDFGVAFQLGLLYYQSGNFAEAKKNFAHAVDVNSSYANARYFLGLIDDRDGDRADAIKQFEEIEKFNADNQEVKKILVNLREGKPALDGIVPPAEPPEKRKEAPVPEKKKR